MSIKYELVCDGCHKTEVRDTYAELVVLCYKEGWWSLNQSEISDALDYCPDCAKKV